MRVTIRELMDKCSDWHKACEIVGLNPWCLNEGLAEETDTVEITPDQWESL